MIRSALAALLLAAAAPLTAQTFAITEPTCHDARNADAGSIAVADSACNDSGHADAGCNAVTSAPGSGYPTTAAPGRSRWPNHDLGRFGSYGDTAQSYVGAS